MTDEQVRELVAAATLPEGWTLRAEVRKRYPYRNLWRVVAAFQGHARAHWDIYRVGPALPAIVEWCERQRGGLIVTSDADGYVTSIEDIVA